MQHKGESGQEEEEASFCSPEVGQWLGDRSWLCTPGLTLRVISQDWKIIELGRDLCRETGPNLRHKLGHPESRLLLKISNYVLVLSHLHIKEMFPDVWSHLCFSLCRLPLGTTEKNVAPSFPEVEVTDQPVASWILFLHDICFLAVLGHFSKLPWLIKDYQEWWWH